jgi:signal transduction histidine kinase
MKRRTSAGPVDLERRLEGARRAQQAAEQASLAKTRFLARMSHDLLTPLNVLIGFPDMLVEGHFGPLNPRQLRAVENVRAAADQLRHQLQDLLDLARLDAGVLSVERVRLDLGALLTEIVEVAAAPAQRRRLTLSGDIASGLPPVLGDAMRLKRVVQSLLDNAFKYTPAGGSVHLRAWSSALSGGEPGVRLAVTDSGAGLAAGECDRVFHLFEQPEAAAPLSGGRQPGAGLGLALARRVVGLHGGRVWAESAGPGAGSSFHVEIPGGEEPAEAGR